MFALFDDFIKEKKIEGIKEIRFLTGLGLKEAKDLYEVLQQYVHAR